MPDLHAWLTEQIAAVEQAAHACPPSPARIDIEGGDYLPGEIRDMTGRVRATGLLTTPAAVLRRCTADRRILERHNVERDLRLVVQSFACQGCGTEGICWDPVAEHINDCPELLNMAAAYGITDEELAALDRPKLAPYPDRPERILPTTPIADVPPALRGPNWKA